MTPSDEMLKESLSALMDNQASDLEVRRILKQLPEDEALAATWGRYQMASTLLQRKQTAYLNVDLSSAIASTIASEPVLNASGSGQMAEVGVHVSPWLRWGTKSAVAASVALAVLIGAQQFSAPAMAPLAAAPAIPSGASGVKPVEVGQQESAVAVSGSGSQVMSVDAVQVQAAPDGFSLPIPSARTVSNQSERVQSFQVQPVLLNQTDWRNDPEVQAQLNQMLLDHASGSASHGSFGLLPFTRVPNISADVSLKSIAEPNAGKN